MKKKILLFGLMLVLALGTSAQAVTVLTFEGLGNLEPIQNFYNGGTGGFGSGPGPAYGIIFGADSLAVIDADVGGGGNFANEPSPSTIAFFLGTSVVMNVPAGFGTGFSFFYTAINNPGSVTVYDGLDASGNVLAVLNLPVTPSLGAGDPTGAFDNWQPVGVAFAGTALSVDFGGSANQIGFDNITLESDKPVVTPIPGTVVLLGSALITLAGLRLRRRA